MPVDGKRQSPVGDCDGSNNFGVRGSNHIAQRQDLRSCASFSVYARQMYGALPLDKPITCDTAYFGGIEINIRNTSPRGRRNSAYSVLLRHLGMNTTWYFGTWVNRVQTFCYNPP
jgi:hypothetical protein